ncbi:YraN family protein [Patescibacteria group bacterium]|nr:YraN family protein [Patescibacteria group bacterium]MBU4022796.1 YraN family protein [Patescibacteria group bacterium]MBU4162379.1 YraN family protein [Patescibacteria group bacterium]
MPNSKEIGEIGEEIARRYLEEKGYKILTKNFFKTANGLKIGEIDIVAQKQGVIIFFEVKTLSNGTRFAPESKINFQKQGKISKIAQIWLDENSVPQESLWQIDALAIVLDFCSRKARISHFQNI